MDIGAPLVADGEAAIAVQPSQGALHHPAMTAQTLTALDALTGDAHPDVTLGQGTAAAGNIIGFVGMGLVRPLAAPSVGLHDRGYGIEQLLKDHRVVAVGPGQHLGERHSAAVGQNVPFGARFAPIGGVGTDEVAPLFAGIEAESRQVRLQSIWPAAPRRSSRARCKASQTPAACQSRSRRQQVIPEPQPISWGNNSHWMPDLRTKMMPLKQARSGTRGRPPLGLGGSAGSSGATMAQSSSLTRGLAIPQVCHILYRF